MREAELKKILSSILTKSHKVKGSGRKRTTTSRRTKRAVKQTVRRVSKKLRGCGKDGAEAADAISKWDLFKKWATETLATQQDPTTLNEALTVEYQPPIPWYNYPMRLYAYLHDADPNDPNSVDKKFAWSEGTFDPTSKEKQYKTTTLPTGVRMKEEVNMHDLMASSLSRTQTADEAARAQVRWQTGFLAHWLLDNIFKFLSTIFVALGWGLLAAGALVAAKIALDELIDQYPGFADNIAMFILKYVILLLLRAAKYAKDWVWWCIKRLINAISKGKFFKDDLHFPVFEGLEITAKSVRLAAERQARQKAEFEQKVREVVNNFNEIKKTMDEVKLNTEQLNKISEIFELWIPKFEEMKEHAKFPPAQQAEILNDAREMLNEYEEEMSSTILKMNHEIREGMRRPYIEDPSDLADPDKIAFTRMLTRPPAKRRPRVISLEEISTRPKIKKRIR